MTVNVTVAIGTVIWILIMFGGFYCIHKWGIDV